MIEDRFSGRHTQAASDAAQAFEEAVWNVLAHRPQAASALDEAIALSPDMVAAHALRGFCGVSLARAETIVAARGHHARALSLVGGASAGERALVDALGLAIEGRLRDSAARLEAHLESSPRDLLALKLAHGLRFMTGDAAGMLAATKAVLPHWSAALDGYGFVLGCHAFALEENGCYPEAEAAGRDAVAIEPHDAWGAHAVGHVYEMQARSTLGIRWLEQTRPMWSGCNNFGFHMAWHLALCHMEQGRFDIALDLYDGHVRPTPTDDFRDIANAASMLWRLGQEQVDVGARWHELADIARRRATDTSLVFASLHHLLSLVATGDRAATESLVAALAQCAEKSDGDQAIAARAGLGFARVLTASSPAAAPLGEIAQSLAPLGGSRAQRDVFMRALAELALRNDRDAEAQAVLTQRGKDNDRFARMTKARISTMPVARRVA